jgi:hypothetical protein
VTSIRAALDTMLAAHEPLPDVVVDRCWNVLAGNRAMAILMNGIPPNMLEPQPNVFRLALHPDGPAGRLANLCEVRALFLERLLRQVDATGDADPRSLYEEVCRYPVPAGDVKDGATTSDTRSGRCDAIGAGDRIVLSPR